MAEQEQKPAAPRDDSFEVIRRQVNRLSVAVVLMALVTLANTAVVYGQMVDWHGAAGMLVNGVGIGAALAGFGFGWFAGRRFG